MKAIAIIELPDDAFDDETWGDGKWMIDDEGAIRYQEDDAWMHYKDIDVDGIELRPLPDEKEQWNRWELDFRDESSYRAGWNDFRKEIYEGS